MEIAPEAREKMARILERADQTLMFSLGIELLSISAEQVIGQMPVDKRTRQPMGLLHGGASIALAETLASIGAWISLPPEKQAVGIEINGNHLRAVRSGVVRGTASPLHRGRTSHVWEVRICNEQDQLVCMSRCTLAIINAKER